MSVDHKDDELPKLSGKDDEIIAKSTNSRAPGPAEERALEVTLIDETRGHTDQQGKNKEAEKILSDSQVAVQSSFYSVDIGNGNEHFSPNSDQLVQTAYVAEATGPETSAADKMVFPQCEYTISEILKHL